ncbi:hypothetical protein CBW18_01120 [Pedobacter sp. AJM]|nr:hypothetical protein CBW18_01120 [Pedobacter sp. AJM]
MGFFKEGYRRNVISPFFIKNILVNFEKVETYNDRIQQFYEKIIRILLYNMFWIYYRKFCEK